MNKRKDKILDILTEQNKVDVVTLSEMLGVSQVTIRKDLDALEQTGIVQREHGFAVLVSTNDILGRLAYHNKEKRRIARKAAEFVEDGESIMIESGSCCAILAEELAQTKKNLTIITNSAFVADYIRKKTDFQIVLLGGIYQHDSQVMTGPLVRLCVENFWVEKFFIGVDGFSPVFGFSNQDPDRAQAVRDMATRARHITVLTESAKFQSEGTLPLNVMEQISCVITDTDITEEAREDLKEYSIDVVTVNW